MQSLFEKDAVFVWKRCSLCLKKMQSLFEKDAVFVDNFDNNINFFVAPKKCLSTAQSQKMDFKANFWMSESDISTLHLQPHQ